MINEENNSIGVPISEMGENTAEDVNNMSIKKSKGKKTKKNKEVVTEHTITSLLPNENPDIGGCMADFDDPNKEPFEFKADGSGGFSNTDDYVEKLAANYTVETGDFHTNWKTKKFNAAIAFSTWNWSAPWLGLLFATVTGSTILGGFLMSSMLLSSFSFYHSYMKNV